MLSMYIAGRFAASAQRRHRSYLASVRQCVKDITFAAKGELLRLCDFSYRFHS
jgi:hypothetical protein